MSKIKANTLENVAGTATTDVSTVVNAMSTPYSHRNKIINGGFDIKQRGTGFTTTSSGQYTLDRWTVNLVGTVVVAARSGTPHIANYIQHKTPAALATHAARLSQTIEDAYTMSEKQITISFWTYGVSGVSNTYIELFTGDTANKFEKSAGTTGFTTTVGVWTKQEIIVTLPAILTDEHLTLCIRYSHTNGVESNLYVSNVQLEEGIVSTPFEVRPLGYELGLCQRYYEASSNYYKRYITTGWLLASADVTFKVEKRAVPSVAIISPNSGLGNYFQELSSASAHIANRLATPQGVSSEGFMAQSLDGTLTINNYAYFRYIADAEL